MFNQIARSPIIGLGFAREANNDVGRNRDAFARLPDSPDKIDIFFRSVSAVHRFEDLVGTGLQREVNVLDQFGQARKCLDQVVPESDRMRRSKAEPLQSVDPVHRFEQLHKWTFIVDLWNSVPPVQIHDLPEQRYFLHSPSHQVAHFAHDLIDRTAPLRSARLRNDAKGAMHVASLHD